MPLTKDSVEVATSDSAAARPGAPAAKLGAAGAGAPQVRADAVSTEVAVRVYGSRIINVPGQLEPNTEPFEEQTSTMIVFPQGAVLRMSTTVAVGQMLVVTNTGTKADAICRVVKVRTFSNTQGYVEVEFTTAQPNYWGVRFPSDGPAPAQAAPAAPAAQTPVAQQPKPAAAPPQAKPAAVAPPAPVATKPVAPPAPAPVQAAPPAPAPVQAAPPAPVAAKPAAPVAPAPVAVAPAPVADAPVEKAPAAPVAVAPPAPVAKVEAPAPVAASPVPQTADLDDDDVETLLNRIAPNVTPAPSQSPVAAAPVAHTSVEIPSAPPAANVPSLSLSDLRGDAIVEAPLAGDDTESIDTAALAGSSASAAVEPSTEAPRRAFGSFSGGASLTGGSSLAAASASTDEAIAESAASAHEESSATIGGDYAEPQKKGNFLMIAACIGVLAVVVAGGIFYFRTSAAGSKAAAPFAADSKSSDAEPVNQPSERTGLNNSAGSSNPASSYSGVPASTATATPVVVPSSAAARTAPSSETATNSGIQVVERPSAAKAKALANAVDATTNAHPVASQRTDASGPGAAPSLDSASMGGGNALSGLVSGNDGSSLRAPEIKVEGPVRVGGDVKEPQVVTRVSPVYPLAAKEAGISGDVVLQTTIDQKGNVVNAKVVSGPVMLRQPALDALKRWRYTPSTLNGQPISVSMSVTIKFSNK